MLLPGCAIPGEVLIESRAKSALGIRHYHVNRAGFGSRAELADALLFEVDVKGFNGTAPGSLRKSAAAFDFRLIRGN